MGVLSVLKARAAINDTNDWDALGGVRLPLDGLSSM